MISVKKNTIALFKGVISRKSEAKGRKQGKLKYESFTDAVITEAGFSIHDDNACNTMIVRV